MKKIELEQRLRRLEQITQRQKLELALCKLGITPEMQARLLESAIKQYKHARSEATKPKKGKKK